MKAGAKLAVNYLLIDAQAGFLSVWSSAINGGAACVSTFEKTRSAERDLRKGRSDLEETRAPLQDVARAPLKTPRRSTRNQRLGA